MTPEEKAHSLVSNVSLFCAPDDMSRNDFEYLVAQALRDARAEGMMEAAELCRLEVGRYIVYPYCLEQDVGALGALGCAKRIMEAVSREEGKV